MGFLEGEGGGKNNAGECVEDEVEDNDAEAGENGDGEDNGENGEEVSWAKGTVDDEDFKEAVEEEEGEGGGKRSEHTYKNVGEEQGKAEVI